MKIKITNLTYEQNNIKYLDNLTYTFEDNKITSVIGPSGSGKTLLTKLLTCLKQPTSGIIKFGQEEVNCQTQINDLKTFRFNVGYLFQKASSVFFKETVYQELEYGLDQFKFRLSIKDKQISDALKVAGLNDHYLNMNPFDLSYGEQTLLALAIMLSLNPKVLILDEPTIGLDNRNKKMLARLLKRMIRKYQKTIILISNDIDFILSVTDNILAINNGQLVISGTKQEVLKHNKLLIQNNIEIPKIIEFINLVSTKKNIQLDYTTNIKDLIKDIYRHV